MASGQGKKRNKASSRNPAKPPKDPPKQRRISAQSEDQFRGDRAGGYNWGAKAGVRRGNATNKNTRGRKADLSRSDGRYTMTTTRKGVKVPKPMYPEGTGRTP